MHQQYTKPPLFAVICNIYFASSDVWNPSFFDTFYNKIQSDFPHKTLLEDLILPKSSFVISATENIKIDSTSGLLEERTKMECKNQDENIKVIFSENLLQLIIVPPYEGWEKIKPIILHTLDMYNEVTQPILIKKAVLKYRNKVNVGAEHSYENMKRFFTTLPQFDTTMGSLSGVQMIIQSKSKDNRSLLHVQQNTLQPEEENKAPVLLDLSYSCINAIDLIEKDKCVEWLEEANTAIHKIFETSFTDKAKSMFL